MATIERGDRDTVTFDTARGNTLVAHRRASWRDPRYASVIFLGLRHRRKKR